MLIDRFGTVTAYSGAFQIIHSAEVDEWQITRPPVTTQIAGASGAFDFYGTANYPLGPMTVSKSFMATASTWAGVETALDNLESNIFNAGEGRLWGIERDGTTHYWTYAKCTALDIGYKVDGNSPPFAGTAVFGQEVSVEFFCRTGEWYPEGGSATVYSPAFNVKLLNGGGTVLTGGTINNVLSVSCEDRLDEAGAISFVVPATDSTVANLLSTAARFKIDFGGGSAVWGIIDKDVTDATAQQPNRTVYGANMLREFQHYSMGWWCFYDSQDIATTILPDILDGTGWEQGGIDRDAGTLYYRFDGDSRLSALIKTAEASGKHFRIGALDRYLDFGAFGEDSGVTFYGRYNDGNYVTYDGIPIVGTLEVTSDRGPIVNRIIPWGAGQDEGNLNRAKVSLFHLDPDDTRWSDVKAKPGVRGVQAEVSFVGSAGGKENAAYTVDDTTGFISWPVTQVLWCYNPENLALGLGYDFVVREIDVPNSIIKVRGSPTIPAPPTSFPAYLISNPQLYIEDAEAYAADPHEAVIIFDDITLADLSLDSFAAAASQLFDRAVQYLNTHKQAQVSYALSTYNCPDSLRVGNTCHVTYAGAVTRNGSTVDWIDIDVDLNVINITRRWNADGSREATIEVSNIAAQPANSTGALTRTSSSVGSHATTVGALGTTVSEAASPGGATQGGTTPPGWLYLTLADDGTAVISSAALGLGTVFVLCLTDGSVAMFSLAGANHVAYEMLDPQEQFTATGGTDGMTNIYCQGGAPYNYYIENKRGGERTYYIWTHLTPIE